MEADGCKLKEETESIKETQMETQRIKKPQPEKNCTQHHQRGGNKNQNNSFEKA